MPKYPKLTTRAILFELLIGMMIVVGSVAGVALLDGYVPDLPLSPFMRSQ